MELSIKEQRLLINKEYTLLAALQKMDAERVKSLLVVEGEQFLGLISIGDIQRAIIRNTPLAEKVLSVVRNDIKVARLSQSPEEIKQMLFNYRAESMPVVDEHHGLVKVYFWEDFFQTEQTTRQLDVKVPVVIMAGGFGSRLKPLTNVIPKPLIPIGDKTILEEIIQRFCNIGLTDFHLTVNYKHEMIRFYMDGLPERNYQLNYVLESQPLGTAGSLSLLKQKIDSTFFVTNCDIIVEEDYTEIYNFHKKNENQITLVASLKHLRIPYGTVQSGENGELIKLVEKPELNFMINTGMYILEPSVLKRIPDNTHIHITEIIDRVKNDGGKVGVFPVSEKSWTDIGEWPEYNKIIAKYLP